MTPFRHQATLWSSTLIPGPIIYLLKLWLLGDHKQTHTYTPYIHVHTLHIHVAILTLVFSLHAPILDPLYTLSGKFSVILDHHFKLHACTCSSKCWLGKPQYYTDTSAVRFVSKGDKLSKNLTAGWIEIFFAGRWGAIRSKGFSLSDAQGLCHILTGSPLGDGLREKQVSRTSQFK